MKFLRALADFLTGLKQFLVMADNNIKKWYVVRAVSGQENKVKAYIETEIARLGWRLCFSSFSSY
jgi:hypothetical protein